MNKLKPKDIKILKLIESWGWITTKLVVKYGFYEHIKSVNRKFAEFQEQNLIKQQQPFRQKPPIYELTSKGMRAVDMPNKNPPSGPTYNEFEHDLTVAHLTHSIFYELEIQGSYRTEREIYQRKGINSGEKIPDLEIKTKNGHSIAIEYENSKKSQSRLENIIRDTGSSAGYGPKPDNRYTQILWIASDESILLRVGKAIPFESELADFSNHFTTGIFKRSEGWISRETKDFRELTN